jgi:hypothetical protein
VDFEAVVLAGLALATFARARFALAGFVRSGFARAGFARSDFARAGFARSDLEAFTIAFRDVTRAIFAVFDLEVFVVLVAFFVLGAFVAIFELFESVFATFLAGAFPFAEVTPTRRDPPVERDTRAPVLVFFRSAMRPAPLNPRRSADRSRTGQ